MNDSLKKKSNLFFDKRDHELIRIVNEATERDPTRFDFIKKRFFPHFHPHGIKEMAESKGLRIAYCVAYLLNYLEEGKPEDRLSALRSLRDEVIQTAEKPIPKNTARVLLEIMKELVRTPENYRRQLELARDFRITASGKARIVRKKLKQYHLLEMPEEWNQVTFDDHVHDANTKGRKYPTHLIMDAWIKGIRRIRVIYYNHITSQSALELLEAADILDIDVRIGIEFSACHRNKYAKLIWVPRGFRDTEDFLCFLAEDSVTKLMNEGKKASKFQKEYILNILNNFNKTHRHSINSRFGVILPPLNNNEFVSFVGSGQASLVHLAKYIYNKLFPLMKERVKSLAKEYQKSDYRRKQEIEDLVGEMNRIDTDRIIEEYLKPEKNPEVPNVNIPENYENRPCLLKQTPGQLRKIISSISWEYRFTLNLHNLNLEDVIEIVYDCEGTITRFESFNLKDYVYGETGHMEDINRFQLALNRGNVIVLKKMILEAIDQISNENSDGNHDRIDKLSEILYDIGFLKNCYQSHPVKSRIGSDSTGHSPRVYGMGLAALETLPLRSRKNSKKSKVSQRTVIPVQISVYLRKSFIPHDEKENGIPDMYHILSRIPLLRYFYLNVGTDWIVLEYSTRLKKTGNLITLGGIRKHFTNDFDLKDGEKKFKPKHSFRYINTGWKNCLKALFGFIPAFATFYLTYDWWVLAFLGAPIWFCITGMRNVVQSVLGGGGLRRSPLLRWNDYVSWERLTDSLLYTGFSVPLLDFFVKNFLLDQQLGINTSTSPFFLYIAIALANGIYLSSHNAFRGLPRAAIFGNFFRSVLSIPLAIALNFLFGFLLTAGGFTAVNLILQKWAAIISKLASDFVAAVIEGSADRHKNIHDRLRDYENKIDRLLELFSQLEMLFPDWYKMEPDPEPGERKKNKEVKDLENILAIHVLDMLYFWMYQPRSRSAFQRMLSELSKEEREVFFRSQNILKRHKEISQLFIDGLLGKNFMKPLSFYLDRSEEYLQDMKKLHDSSP